MRPRQWTKNLILLAPILFSLELGRLIDVFRAAGAVALFCIVSSAVYIMNDLHDLERDRAHAVRRLRPLAAGELEPRTAMMAVAVLLLAGLGGALLLGPGFALITIGYVALQAVYTFFLKDEVILDVMVISAGFVLRVTAGAVAVHVVVSPWLLSCAALLALFLALVKRRHELLADSHALEHRPVLRKYTPALLDQAIAIVTSSTFVVYAIYTFLSQSAADRPYLMLTIPFVGYGFLRYLYLMHAHQLGGSPEEILLSDGPLAVDLGLWILVVVIILYLT
jgi:4-hydroxybenzoate polyprenyltransferase